MKTFAYMVAPTCAGKGFLMNLLKRSAAARLPQGAPSGIAFIAFGDIVKDRLKTDEDFNRRFAASMAEGKLVDDTTANSIFESEVLRLKEQCDPDLFVVDGFCRSTPQIAFASNKGFLDRHSKVFMIDASIETCADRFAHRQKHSPGRIDAELPTLHKRYHLHTDMAPDLRSMFKESDCQLIDVDGNRGIPDYVFPEVIGHLIENLASAQANALARHRETQTRR